MKNYCGILFPLFVLQLTMVEVLTDVQMIRGGSMEPMVTMEIHHNDDRINENNKKDIGNQLAEVVREKLAIHRER